VETPATPALPAYDPDCYLCPGNERADGNRNPHYEHTHVFDNDFPALVPVADHERLDRAHLLRAEPERGVCRVLCFTPRHDLTLADMEIADIRRVVDVWAEETEALGCTEFVRHVQVFENKGAMMGASNPHPHCQIWASESVPAEALKEERGQMDYLEACGRCLLCDYARLESAANERMVARNDDWIAVVPFWAVWPFETLVLPRRHVVSLPGLHDEERDALSALMRELTRRYDRLFDVSFPYSMGWHQAPFDGRTHAAAHLHAHYYPPLLRSATVRKFMVGFEMLAAPQRDFTPESAAERLRAADDRANSSSG
jgi:UDPglucose--hexose-1-phosphate uridylyltransferase